LANVTGPAAAASMHVVAATARAVDASNRLKETGMRSP
jgi:hypothetical protein